MRYVLLDEKITRVAPFGVRFYDPVGKQLVTGLTVTARAAANPARVLDLFPNPSGVYVLQNAPGLRDFENGAGDADFWARLPAPRQYTIEVSDPRGEFLPFTFAAALPVKGLYVWDCEPSPPESSDVPLFSTPRRPIPAGYTAIRADLCDPIANQPAAWALLEVTYEGRVLGRGIADARGCLCLPLAYPPPVDFEPLSPMVTGAPLTEQSWRVGFQVWYAALAGQPDLCAILDQRRAPAAHIWETWDSPPGAAWLTEAEIVYGRELVLRTSEAGSPLPNLYIAPAGSPP